MSDRPSRKILLVGWDTADWKIVAPMLDAGELPCLKRLVGRGTVGPLRAESPFLSPLLWTSIVTGRRADAHNILTGIEPDPDVGGSRPASSLSRTCKAIWNVLSHAGLRPHAVNWVASHPAEPTGGVCVSDQFATVVGPRGHAWPLRPDSVHPRRLEETLAAFRVHPSDVDDNQLTPFVPELARVDRKADRRIEILATHLANTASYHSMATYLLEHEPCEFLAVRYASFDPLAHHFLPFRPPRIAHVSDGDFTLYHDVIAALYRLHDTMLGRLVELAGPDATTIVVSDHGFSASHLRTPAYDRSRPETIVSGHRNTGFLIMAGAGIRRDHRFHGATVLDIAPTIQSLLAVPIGEDQEGRPLLEALEAVEVPARIASWESIPKTAGRHRRETNEDTAEMAEIIERLAFLGYAEESDEDLKKRAQFTRQRTLNLALAHLSANRPAAALPLFEGLLDRYPNDISAALQTANCYLLLNRFIECRRVIDAILARRVDHGSVELLRAKLELAQGRPELAIEALLKAKETMGTRTGLEVLIGRCYLSLNRGEEAERTFRAVLARDNASTAARHGLALSRGMQGRRAEAVEAARTGVAPHDHVPQSQRAAGIALTTLDQIDRAIQELEECNSLDLSDVGTREPRDGSRRFGVEMASTRREG